MESPPTPGTGNNPAEEDKGFRPGADARSAVKPVTRTRRARKAVQDFLGGDYLSKEWVTGNILFILYAGLLAMIYIGNTYSTERKFKDIDRTKVELKELRYRYITTKSTLMFQGRQSEISRRAATIGLHESMIPPFKVLYPGTDSNKTRTLIP